MQDKVEGKVASMWAEAFKGSSLPTVDVTADFVDAMAVKDTGEVTNAKRAAFLAARIMKDFVVPKLEGGWCASSSTLSQAGQGSRS